MFVLDLRELIIYAEYYISANWARGNEDDLLLSFLFTDMSPTPVMYCVHRIPLLTSLPGPIFVLGISPVQIAWENLQFFFISGYALLDDLVAEMKSRNILFQVLQHSTMYPLQSSYRSLNTVC